MEVLQDTKKKTTIWTSSFFSRNVSKGKKAIIRRGHVGAPVYHNYSQWVGMDPALHEWMEEVWLHTPAE